MVDVLVTVLPLPGTVTVCPGRVTVDTRVDVITVVLCPPPTVTVDGRPVTVTVLPGLLTVDTLVDVTTLVTVRPGLCTVCVTTPAALVITEVLVTVFALPVTVTVRPG